MAAALQAAWARGDEIAPMASVAGPDSATASAGADASMMAVPAFEAAPADSMSVPRAPATAAAATVAPAVGRSGRPLTRAEADLLRRYDANHDGKLDDQELAVAHAEMEEKQIQSGGQNGARLYARLLEQFDRDHNGRLDPDEQAAALIALKNRQPEIYQRLAQRFDRNQDGEIDAQEGAAMFAVLEKVSETPRARQAAVAGMPVPPRSAATAGTEPASGSAVMAPAQTTLAGASAASPGPAAGSTAAARRPQITAFVQRIYARLLENFDTEHKGSLSPAQQMQAVAYLRTHNPAVYARMVDRFDKNGDGMLGPDEADAMFRMMASMASGAPVAKG